MLQRQCIVHVLQQGIDLAHWGSLCSRFSLRQELISSSPAASPPRLHKSKPASQIAQSSLGQVLESEVVKPKPHLFAPAAPGEVGPLTCLLQPGD